MKKVLFATTALALSAGVASAQGIELGGSGNFGLANTGAGDAFLKYEIDFDIIASGTTDNGLTFGASMDFDAAQEGTTLADRDPELFVSGAFGTLTVGTLDAATDGMGLPGLGFDGIGMDDDVEALRISGEADVSYAYDVAGFSVLLTMGLATNNGTTAAGAALNTAAEGDYGILLGYSFGDFSVQAGYTRDDGNAAGINAADSYGIQGAYTYDMLTLTALYAAEETNGTTTTGYGLNAAYAFDAFTVSASYADTDAVGDDADYGIGASYDLGGGLSLAGAVGSVNGNNVWDLGVTMSF